MENATWIILGVALMVILVYIVPPVLKRSEPERNERDRPPLPTTALLVTAALIVLAIVAHFVW